MAVPHMQRSVVFRTHLMSSVPGQVFTCVLVGGQGALAGRRLSCKAHFLPTSIGLFATGGLLEFDSEARGGLVRRTVLHRPWYFGQGVEVNVLCLYESQLSLWVQAFWRLQRFLGAHFSVIQCPAWLSILILKSFLSWLRFTICWEKLDLMAV